MKTMEQRGSKVEESDKELIDSFLAGSDSAFEQLYNRYEPYF